MEGSLYQGLTTKEVKIAQKKYGKNIIDKQKKDNIVLLFLKEFKDPMLLVLIGASLISIFLKEYIDAFIILFVVFLNVIISFIQELKASRALESLKELSAPKCFVKRDNKIIEISSSEVVVGDLIILEEGLVIPCDAKLISINQLLVDESSLTGESFPVAKSFAINKDDLLRLDYVYSGSEIVKGNGLAICIAIGNNTEIGKIASIASKKKEQTPLEKRLDKLGYQLGIVTIIICIIVFAVSLLKGGNVLDVFITSISLGVAAIPEGLASVVTIVLSLGVQKMAKKKAIVSKLSSVETLGMVTIICSDKTGTLTKNKMEVKECFFLDKISDEFILFKEQISYFLLCLTSSSDKGDPTEKAILDLGKKLNINIDSLDKKYPLISLNPFTSEKKIMEVERLIDGRKIKIIKGAPEIIINKCNYYNDRFLNELDKYNINNKLKKLTKKALRLIACMIEKDDKKIFIGVLGLKDPLKEESKEAVKKMLDSSVAIKMITGDHKETAFEIAKELKVAHDISQVMEGKEIDSLDQKEFLERLKISSVFARVSPLHKMKIVEGYQSLNEVVAMTGDGVNDAPSLKKAHVGIAMGKSGKEVAKESADIIIQDDNFSTIVLAMEEGRSIYVNIKKAVLFLLSSNIAEVLVMFLGIVFSLPLPLLAIHILFINLISDSIPALCLGLDKKDKDIMKQKINKEKDTLFSKGSIKMLIIYSLLICFITLGVYFLPTITHIFNNNLEFSIKNILEVINIPSILIKSRTMAFSCLSFCELFHMVGMSSTNHSIIYIIKKKNYFLLITFLIAIILQIIIVQVPLLNTVFKTVPLSINEWCGIFLLSFIVIIVHEIMIKPNR